MKRKTFFAAFALLFTLALLPQNVRADGMMVPPLSSWQTQRERALISEPSQKAAIFYRGSQEQLIISPSYQGPPGGFAWVIPVPARPQVKILQGALFHELARVVEPAPPVAVHHLLKAGRAMEAAGAAVTVLERRTVGAYDVSVLSATDSGALARWLRQNRYFLPDAAKRPLAGYIEEKWTFVACRVKIAQNARGLQSGTLAPLSLTFPSPNLVYPMRLSSVNPRPFGLLLYLLCPAVPGQPLPQTWPGASPPALRFTSVSPFRTPGAFPTLERFDTQMLMVHWMEKTIRPQECTRDFVWAQLLPK